MSLLVHPQSELIREPRLLAPRKNALSSYKVDFSLLPGGRACSALFDGEKLYLNKVITPITPGMIGGSPVKGADAVGKHYLFSGSELIRASGVVPLAATTPVTLEVIVALTAAPSLANIAGIAQNSSGIKVSLASPADLGKIRSLLAFTGTPPCDIYPWQGSNDFDSNVPLLVNGLYQHIIYTKAGGSGAAAITVYRNGVQIATGTTSNSAALTVSDTYFCLGGCHNSASSSFSGKIYFAAVSEYFMSAGEVASRFAGPFSMIVPA